MLLVRLQSGIQVACICLSNASNSFFAIQAESGVFSRGRELSERKPRSFCTTSLLFPSSFRVASKCNIHLCRLELFLACQKVPEQMMPSSLAARGDPVSMGV